MSTETQQFKTLMAQMGLLAETGRNYDRAYREVIGRFEALKKERDAAVARAEQAEQARDAAEATIATLRGGRGEGAQRTDVRTVQDMFERLRLVHGQEAKSVHERIIARCKGLVQERDASEAAVVALQNEKSVEAQRAAHLADEVRRLTQERDTASAALAAEREHNSIDALRMQVEASAAEIDRARRERTEVVSENLRVANVVVDMRARINQLQEENLLLKKQLSAQEAATLAAEQRAAVAPSGAATSDMLARLLEEAERSASAWQEVASDGADELRRARYIIAVQASRLDDFQRHQPAEPEPPTQDSP